MKWTVEDLVKATGLSASGVPYSAKYIKRFWKKIRKTNSCWYWTGHKNNKGYGFVWNGKKQVTAHRFSWELHCGEIPESLFVCHSCDRPLCINPEHLFLGTALDNAADRDQKGRQISRPPRGEQNSQAKLTESEVREIRRKYKPRIYSQRKLAHEYNVSRQLIRCVLQKVAWRHVK